MSRIASQFVVQVAVPSPLRRNFDYLPPAGAPLPQAGSRVRVDFGRQQLIGFVTGVDTDSTMSRDKLRPILDVLEPEPLLDGHLLALYRWASTYYLYPLGQALQTSLPKALREGQPATLAAPLAWRLTDTATADSAKVRGTLQQQALDSLRQYQHLTTPELTTLLGKAAKPVLTTLTEKGLVQQVEIAADEFTPSLAEAPLTPDSEQASALETLRQAGDGFRCFLLEGITGSGKTEIYLQRIADVLAQGKQALVLVPEINLTPQTITRFSRRFHARIVAFHSGLTEKQRLQGWLQARNGSAHIIIGTRSAVFTPLANPGLIVIDEEHDDSYKQQEGFRYCARDVAIYRASMLKIPVLLGSATPSLESLNNALSGRYQLLQLTKRAGSANPPDIRVLDLKMQQSHAGISELLQQQIADTLNANQQALVFINRRGFAPLLLCRDCGWIAECPRCDRSYTLHRQPSQLRCHHCDAQKPVPRSCAACGSHALETMGIGTERSADYLASQFPDYPVLRIDRDTTRAQGKLEELMQTVHSGIPCILVGTQMVAKGHHFPKVSLVAVLDADSGLFSADFRAQENLGQLLTQVAGRAGRGDIHGRVVVQTYHPQHPSLLQLVSEGYGSFARQLLNERSQGHLPPFVHFIMVRAEANKQQLPLDLLHELALELQREAPHELQLFGPMPSPFGKKAGQFRAQLLLQATRRAVLQKAGSKLTAWLEAQPQARKVRWLVDVDPIDFS